jgi:hypothetical protein
MSNQQRVGFVSVNIHSLAPSHSTFSPAYNLFRHRADQELCCAVLQDCAVPLFISDESWRFEQTVVRPDRAPIGFREYAARHAALLNGYYLFQATL